MTFAKTRMGIFALLFATLFSCQKDPSPPPATVDLLQARLNDFQLAETAYANITVTHPTVSGGVETQQGEIRITVPKGNRQLQLTPKASNFTHGDFTLLPKLGEKQDFLNRTVIYTIASKTQPSKAVHYAVIITEEQPTTGGQTALTSFRFEKAKNPSLAADVVADRIVEGAGTLGEVFIFVPAGTSLSSLTATIGFQGTGLFYSQDANGVPANSTTAYPAAGLSMDYAYPKVFYAVVKNGANVKTYNVIVDVKNPIHFDNAAVSSLNAPVGKAFYEQVTTFLNQGNHTISLIAVNHSDALPAGTSAIRGSGIVPNGGVKPGERAAVYATVSTQTYPVGTYQVTAAFKPRIVNHENADNLLTASPLRIASTIVP